MSVQIFNTHNYNTRFKITLAIAVVLFCSVNLSHTLFAQKDTNSTFYKRYIAVPDTLNKKRYQSVAIGSACIWTGSLAYLNQTWYSQYTRGSFKFFNDIGEWQQVDKIGHMYSSYLGAKLCYTFFRWTGTHERKSILLGAGGGLAYLSVIEILDGFSNKWGFSLPDMAANTIGCAGFGVQQWLWHNQRIIFKYSTHIQNYKTVELLKRANNLYGSTTAERILKDYNAQTYWLSCNIKSFAPKSKWPAWLNIAIGYGAQGMYGGYKNIALDDNGQVILNPNGSPSFDRQDIARYRQFYISPDIDFSKIPWKSKFIRDFTKMVNLKVPFPSIEFNSLGNPQWHWYHF
jgi:hypothetical protein